MTLQDAIDRLQLQTDEFDALVNLSNAYGNLPQVVDDDYPRQRRQYEMALRLFIATLELNGRMRQGR